MQGKKNSTAKVKARNFLTNISYRCYKLKDFKNEAFLIDIYSLVLQNLNTLMINTKFDIENNRNYVKMLWNKCIPQESCDASI